MPALTYSNSAFVTLTVISSAVMNAFFTDITTWANTTKLDYLNLQAAGVRASNITSQSSTIGQVLMADGAGAATFSTKSSGMDFVNGSFTNSANAGTLTIGLKTAAGSDATASDPVFIAFRHPTVTNGTYNQRAVTAALSMTVASTTTLGMLSAQNNNLWIYGIDSDGAGTIKLGASTVQLDEGSLQSAVAESVAGTVTIASPGVWTAAAHGLNNGDAVIFTTTGALPTGLTAGTTYYVVVTATNTFQVATFPGGSSINTSVSQSGTHTIRVASPRLVSNAAYLSKPIRLLGRGIFNLVTAGTWIAAAEMVNESGYRRPENIFARYYGTTTTVSSSLTSIIYPTRVVDTHNMYNTTTGRIYIPKTGVYRFGVCQLGPTLSWTVGANFNATLLINAVINTDLFSVFANSSFSNRLAGSGFAEVSLSQGDTVVIQMLQVSSAAMDITDSYRNFFTVSLVS